MNFVSAFLVVFFVAVAHTAPKCDEDDLNQVFQSLCQVKPEKIYDYADCAAKHGYMFKYTGPTCGLACPEKYKDVNDVQKFYKFVCADKTEMSKDAENLLCCDVTMQASIKGDSDGTKVIQITEECAKEYM